MDFVQPLETFLSNFSIGCEYYRKSVICIQKNTIIKEQGVFLLISSDGTVTFNFDGEDRDYHIKSIKDIELIDEDSTYDKLVDDDQQIIAKRPAISIKDKIDDIVKYKIVQHLIYVLSTNNDISDIEPLNIENRKKYLNTKTLPAIKREIGKNILNMKQIELNDDLERGLTKWLNQYQSTGHHTSDKYLFDKNDLLSLLNSFRIIWIIYIKQNNDKIATNDEKKEDEQKKSCLSYIEWDKSSDIEEEAKRDRNVQDEIRNILDRIFLNDKHHDGILEDELITKLIVTFRFKLKRNAKRKKRTNRNYRNDRKDDKEIEEESRKAAEKVIEFMRFGFLYDEYSLDVGDAYGNRMYRRNYDDEYVGVLDEEEAKEIDTMAEKFHSLGGGHKFTIKDVQKFFGSADDGKVKRLCYDMKNDIFDGLFITIQKSFIYSTGEYIFVKKSN